MIDPSIPLGVRPYEPPDPLRTLAGFAQLRTQRESAEALAEQRRAMADDRAAQTAERERATAVHTGSAESITAGGGVRDKTLTWATQHAPQSLPSLTEFFDKSDKSAAELKKLRGDLNNARLDHLGHLADGVLQHGATPEALQTALALYGEQFPDEADDVTKFGERLMGAPPEQIKAFLTQQRDAAPFFQARQTKLAERGPTVVAPGGTVLAPDNTTPLYTAPKEPTKPPSAQEYEYAKTQGYTGTYQQYQNEDANRKRSVTTINTAQSKDDVAETVKGMKDGTLPPQLPGRASKEYVAIMAEAHRQGYDLATAATDWTVTQKHFQTLNGAQQTRIRQAVDTAYHSLDIIDTLADKWKGGKYPALNKITLTAAKQGAMGKEAQSIATQLDAQISDLTSELANVYMGGNSPTDHAMTLAAKNLSANWSNDVLRDMTKLARTNLQMRQNAIKNVGAMGTSESNPYGPKTTEPPKTAAPGGAQRKPIPGVPGGIAELQNGKWIRVQ